MFVCFWKQFSWKKHWPTDKKVIKTNETIISSLPFLFTQKKGREVKNCLLPRDFFLREQKKK